MRKILRIEEPPKKDRHYYTLWVVYFDFGNGKEFPAYMDEDSFNVLMKEEELIKKGCNIKDLEDYKHLVQLEAIRNEG